MNKLAEYKRGDCCITRGVDSGEKTLDTTIGNESHGTAKRGEKRSCQKLVP